MPRNGSGIYSQAPGTTAVPNTPIESAPYNAMVADFVADANAARPVVAGGTGSPNAPGARINLGLEIGTHVQAYNANLASLSGLTFAPNKGLRSTAANTAALFDLTDAALDLLDDADFEAMRTTLELGSAAQADVSDDADLDVDPDAVPTRGAVAGALETSGGLTFIAEAEATNDAAITFTGFDETKYGAYRLVISNLTPATDGGLLYMRTSGDGGATFDSGVGNYQWAFTSGNAAGSISRIGNENATEVRLGGPIGGAAGEDGWSGELTMPSPHLEKRTHVLFVGQFQGTNGSLDVAHGGGGMRNASTAVDAVQFLFSNGNIASGTIALYGMRKL